MIDYANKNGEFGKNRNKKMRDVKNNSHKIRV